jgi:hypothetical protein
MERFKAKKGPHKRPFSSVHGFQLQQYFANTLWIISVSLSYVFLSSLYVGALISQKRVEECYCKLEQGLECVINLSESRRHLWDCDNPGFV